MKRLTHARSNGIKTGYLSPNKKEELINRLAEYEDTGLTPQEIYSLKAGTILKVIRGEWIPVEEALPENPDVMVLVQVSGWPVKNIELIDVVNLHNTIRRKDGFWRCGRNGEMLIRLHGCRFQRCTMLNEDL